MWPERRWKRKWSEIIDSLIGNLIGPAHVPELGQDRPARGGRGAGGEGGAAKAQRGTHRSQSGHGLATKVNKGAQLGDGQTARDIRKWTCLNCVRVVQPEEPISELLRLFDVRHAPSAIGLCNRKLR